MFGQASNFSVNDSQFQSAQIIYNYQSWSQIHAMSTSKQTFSNIKTGNGGTGNNCGEGGKGGSVGSNNIGNHHQTFNGITAGDGGNGSGRLGWARFMFCWAHSKKTNTGRGGAGGDVGCGNKNQ
ncbi:hypothetical protein BT96DRAFT_924093 [Gymnopus androsaceus JB14]|uniref:Uncharacterized protein n=1 Tax=Gymnopus androsaceus JB14 TaxID=1447944 RepID=A0A6A4H544_9AGAR|nr:hypothetical protein BT96DRAFT_924093 [Gymnopus androsaceus JB14]